MRWAGNQCFFSCVFAVEELGEVLILESSSWTTREAVSQFRRSVQEVMKQTGKINGPKWVRSDAIQPRLLKELIKQTAKLPRVVCNLLRNFLESEGKSSF